MSLQQKAGNIVIAELQAHEYRPEKGPKYNVRFNL